MICELDIQLNFERPFESLGQLTGAVLSIGEQEQLGDDLGSIYAFSAHNPVDWHEIRFGRASGDSIQASMDLVLDFEYESDIGGQPKFSVETELKVERRWEL